MYLSAAFIGKQQAFLHTFCRPAFQKNTGQFFRAYIFFTCGDNREDKLTPVSARGFVPSSQFNVSEEKSISLDLLTAFLPDN